MSFTITKLAGSINQIIPLNIFDIINPEEQPNNNNIICTYAK